MATPRPSVYTVASGAGVYAGIAAPPPAPAPALTFTAGASSGTVGGASIAGPTISAPGGNALPVDWSVTSTPAGQTATPASGTLAPGASVTPTLSAVSALIYTLSVANNSGGLVNGAASPGSAGNVQWYAPTPPPPPPPPSTGTPQPFTLTSASSGVLPFAIGYAMSQGHVPAGQSLSFSGATAKLAVLATWPDGSARHGIIAGTYTSAGSAVTVTPTVATVTAGTALTGAAVQTAMGANTAVFDAGAFGSAPFSGADFASPFLTPAATDTFIEAIYRKQIGSDAHLVAWLSMRVWSSGQVEALPWVENGYMRVAGPTSKSATYSFTFGGTSRFSALIDLPHHARTPLVSGALLSHWLATDPAVVPKHNADYMMSTRLVPTYSATVSPAAAVVTALPSTYTPLQVGSYTADMPSTGYHPDIGLLPEWDVLYLTSTASSVWGALQRNAYSAGRWGIYYRDEGTNRIPRFSTNANWSTNSSTTSDLPPTPTGTSPGLWDVPHHPSMGYMAYLVTGRWFHLETCQHVAAFNGFFQPSGTREGASCVFLSSSGAATVRGAGWAMRSLAQAASITPDGDTTIKAELIASLEANINWNHARYVAIANNPYGIVETYGDTYGTPSDGKVTGAPWQQDFYTASWGYALAADPSISSTARTKLAAVFDWLAISIVGRLGSITPTEWLYRDAAPYNWVVALVDSPDWTTGTGPWPTSWGAMYDATYTTSPGPRTVGDLRGGNFPAVTSYWGNLLPAISYAVEHGATGAAEAYSQLIGASNWSTLTAGFDAAPVWSVKPPTDPSIPTWASAVSVGEWGAISSSALSSSGAGWTGTAPGGSGNYTSIVTAWGGGVLNTVGIWRAGSFVSGTFLIIFGGGHGDYAGNEVMAFGPLDTGTPTWSRITDPTIPAASNVSRIGGYPVSRHTYDALVYLPAVNKMLCIGQAGIYTSGSDRAAADVFDFAQNPSAGNPWSTADTGFPAYNGGGITMISMVSGYDSATGKAWGLGKGNFQRIGAFNSSSSTWQDWAIDNPDASGNGKAALAPSLSILAYDTGSGAANSVRAVDLRSTPSIYTPTVTGTGPTNSRPVLEWDSAGGRFVSWGSTGKTVYYLTPSATPYAGGAAWVWTSETPAGGATPASAATNGVFSRFRIVSGLGWRGVLLMSDATSSVNFFRIA